MAKKRQQNKEGGPASGFGKSFLGNFFLSLVILFLVVSAYSFISGSDKKEEISLTELATAVKVGDVQEISVKAGGVEAVFKNSTIKVTKKENGSSIEETLAA